MDRKYRTQRGNNLPKATWQSRDKARNVIYDSLFGTPTCPLPPSSFSILLYMHTIEETATGVGQWKSHTKTSLVLAICRAEYLI